jgi:hypothetical protein
MNIGMQSLGHAGSYRGMYCWISSMGYGDTGKYFFWSLVEGSLTTMTDAGWLMINIGGVMLIFVSLTAIIISILGYKTYCLVKDNTIQTIQAPAPVHHTQSMNSPSSPNYPNNDGTTSAAGGGPARSLFAHNVHVTISKSSAAATSPAGGGVGGGGPKNVMDPIKVVFKRTLLLLSVYFLSFLGSLLLAPINAARINAPIELEIIAGWMIKVTTNHQFSLILTTNLCNLNGQIGETNTGHIDLILYTIGTS